MTLWVSRLPDLAATCAYYSSGNSFYVEISTKKEDNGTERNAFIGTILPYDRARDYFVGD